MIMPAMDIMEYKMSQLSAQQPCGSEIAKQDLAVWKIGLKKVGAGLSLPVKHINIFGSMKEVFLSLKR